MRVGPLDTHKNEHLDELLAKRIMVLGDDNKYKDVMSEIYYEIVKNTPLLCPYDVSSVDYSEEDGFAQDSNITFNAILNKDTNLKYTAIFSDTQKLETWELYDEEKRNFLEMSFFEYYNLIKDSKDIEGFILNPYLDHLVLTQETMGYLFDEEMDDSIYMDSSQIVESIKQYAIDEENISKIWFNDTDDIQIVVDYKESKEDHLDNIKSIAEAFTDGDTKVVVRHFTDLSKGEMLGKDKLIYKKKFKLF